MKARLAVKNFVYRHETLKNVFLFFRRKKQKRIQKRQEKVFLKRCDPVIQATANALKELPNHRGFFCFGTLLGMVREGNIIGRDLDIDVGIVVDDQEDIGRIASFFESKGFKMHLSYKVSGVGINQQSFFKDGVNVDVSYFFQNDDSLITYLLYNGDDVLYFQIPFVKDTKWLSFHGVTVPIPDNPEGVLASLYGEDWRIPNAHYVYWDNPCATKIPAKGQVTKIVQR